MSITCRYAEKDFNFQTFVFLIFIFCTNINDMEWLESSFFKGDVQVFCTAYCQITHDSIKVYIHILCICISVFSIEKFLLLSNSSYFSTSIVGIFCFKYKCKTPSFSCCLSGLRYAAKI